MPRSKGKDLTDDNPYPALLVVPQILVPSLSMRWDQWKEQAWLPRTQAYLSSSANLLQVT